MVDQVSVSVSVRVRVRVRVRVSVTQTRIKPIWYLPSLVPDDEVSHIHQRLGLGLGLRLGLGLGIGLRVRLIPANTKAMLVTLDTSHLEILPVNAFAPGTTR